MAKTLDEEEANAAEAEVNPEMEAEVNPQDDETAIAEDRAEDMAVREESTGGSPQHEDGQVDVSDAHVEGHSTSATKSHDGGAETAAVAHSLLKLNPGTQHEPAEIQGYVQHLMTLQCQVDTLQRALDDVLQGRVPSMQQSSSGSTDPSAGTRAPTCPSTNPATPHLAVIAID